MVKITSAMLQQSVRMAAAGTLAMATIKVLGFPASIWAPLSALAVLQSQIGGSLVASRNYFIASATGVLVGAVTVRLVGDNVLLAGAGMFAIVLLAALLGLPAATMATAAGVVPVLVLSVSGSPWEYGGYRLIDIAIGILSANIVGLLLWPSRAIDALRRSVGDAIRMSCSLLSGTLRDLAAGHSPPTPDVDTPARIAQQLAAAQALLPAARGEPLHAPVREMLPFYVANAERIFESASHAAEVVSIQLPDAALHPLAPHLTAVAGGIDAVSALLAHAVQSGATGQTLPDLAAALGTLKRARDDVLAVDLVSLAQGEALLQLHSLALALRDFVEELARETGRVQHPEQVATPAELARMDPAARGAPPHARRWWRRLWT